MLKRIFGPNMPLPNNQMPYYENYDFKRLETELTETKRQLSELSKRVCQLENYLGIRKDQKYYY